VGFDDRLRPVGDLKFAENIGDVVAHGFIADHSFSAIAISKTSPLWFTTTLKGFPRRSKGDAQVPNGLALLLDR
jgi:hypothetical protein